MQYSNNTNQRSLQSKIPPQPYSPPNRKSKRISPLRATILGIVVAILIYMLYMGIMMAYGFIFGKVSNSEFTSHVSVEGNIKTNSDLEKYVGRLIELPKEQPVARFKVRDVEALKAQSDFYKDIKIGDYLLVYPSLIIIYDANKDIIIKTMSLK